MCTSLLPSWVVFSPSSKTGRRQVFTCPPDGGPPQMLPCGGCMECRKRRVLDWTVRNVHESKFHSRSCFITLTYNDEFLPSDHSLRPRDLQLFMKRVRDLVERPVRFFACGEYGDLLGRPHYHVLLYGENFAGDAYRWDRNARGDWLYRSDTLEKAWSIGGRPKGHCDFGAVTPQSCGYVAGYSLKKITGGKAKEHYEYKDEHGELHDRLPEFVRMSNRPGIGLNFLEKYEPEIFANDSVILNGKERPVPKYYDKKIAGRSFDGADFIEELKRRREGFALLRPPQESTPERLAQIEAFHVAMAKRQSRSFDGR